MTVKPSYTLGVAMRTFLFEANEKAVAELRRLGLTIDYRKDHGRHEWYYWNQQLEALLDWLPIAYHKEERLS